MLLRSSWGKDLNRYLYFSYRNVFWGIRQGIYNLGIDFDIDKKENFAPSDLNKDGAVGVDDLAIILRMVVALNWQDLYLN